MVQEKRIVIAQSQRQSSINFTKRRISNFMHVVYSISFVWLLHAWSLDTVSAVTSLRAHSPYLYAGDAYPVIEYIVSHMARKDNTVEEQNVPTFLFDTNPGYRIVQFYSSRYDPTSIRIRDSYIQLGNIITEIAHEQQSNITIDVHAVCCATVPNLCEKHGIDIHNGKTEPIFMIYKPGSSVGQNLYKLSISTIFEAMGLYIDSRNIDLSLYNDIHIDLIELADGKDHHMRSIDELRNDIHLAFDTLMRNYTFVEHDENGKVHPLSDEKRNALKNYLLLIQKTIPHSWHIHTIVKELINSFTYICKNKAYMVAILDKHQPNTTEYSPACQTGQTHVSGYTCGTWEMMHAISVGAVELNKMTLQAEVTHKHLPTLSINTTASLLRDFIYHFGLGDNDVVRQQFVQHVDICKEEQCLQVGEIPAMVSEWIKLPLFISKTHTDIKMKMIHETAKKEGKYITSFQQHMLTMWPPKQHCPKCWDDNGRWITDVVYKFMQLEYTDLKEWSLSQPEIRKELLGAGSIINSYATSKQRQLLSNPFDSPVKTLISRNILFTLQLFAILSASAVLVLYQLFTHQQKMRQQSSMLILPQSITTSISRNKSLGKSDWVSYIIDQKKS